MTDLIPSIQPDFPEALQWLFKPKRYKVLKGGRGAGRSWGAARALLIQGLNGHERVLCARELQASIKDSVHKLLADQINLMQMNYLYDVQQQGIYGIGGAKGTEFAFEGIRHNITKIKSYEGVTKCWLEEADKLTRYSLEVLIPTIRTPGSELWFTFNPDQEDDEVYQRFVINPDGLDKVKTHGGGTPGGWECKEYPNALRGDFHLAGQPLVPRSAAQRDGRPEAARPRCVPPCLGGPYAQGARGGYLCGRAAGSLLAGAHYERPARPHGASGLLLRSRQV